MYSDWVLPGFFTAFFWLVALSFLVFRQGNFLKALFPKIGKRDIRKKFEEVTSAVSDFKTELKTVEEKLSKFEADGLKHIQKVALLRYNPYGDTGGDQSFSVALLDKKGWGIVLTSLHARGGTRIFAKPIVEGKGSKHRLSKEEEEVVEKAIKQYGE